MIKKTIPTKYQCEELEPGVSEIKCLVKYVFKMFEGDMKKPSGIPILETRDIGGFRI